MSIHAYGNTAEVMTWDDIKAIAPVSSALISLTLNALDIQFVNWIQALSWGDASGLEADIDDAKAQEVMGLFQKLREEFIKKTTVRRGRKKFHLDLDPLYVSSDAESEDSDTLSKGTFAIYGITAPTPAGKKFDKQIQHVNWVETG